ncbi:hypothetical protein [Nitrospira sp. Kam-Ns4a]
MLRKDQREGAVELEEIERRRQALKSLMSRRKKQLRESLDQRIKRAGEGSVWASLSRADCATLHQQEIEHLRVQLQDLHLECAQAQRQLSALRRVMTRAQRLRAARASDFGGRRSA